jgi:hypothetical protein
LNALIKNASAYDEIPYLARAERYFESYGDDLRAALKDGFKSYFEKTLEQMASSGWGDDSIQKAKAMAG